ncbi:hypothetical protein [Ectothiorhodospira marina]|uniref:Preprotein translocase subunit SecB n=1 Tax=Ectothiorhodospira marina TaxID=1396821 RepID=A0A1H7RSK0_9GAMM|nr:hypothetical protein [Ectothiorhodospira marina]SEL63183.1 Preprotein translocase subunit SecB [Ectothiorhodospira marina]
MAEASRVKPSPLTLHGIQFVRVLIEADLESDIVRASQFNFDGSMLNWALDYGYDDQDKTWWVAVGFGTAPDDERPRCPYILDVQAVGVFSVSEKYPADKHEGLAFEYGAALVYGAIREMVTNITSRSLAGTLMLPTPSFVGAFEMQRNGQSDEQPSDD